MQSIQRNIKKKKDLKPSCQCDQKWSAHAWNMDFKPRQPFEVLICGPSQTSPTPLKNTI